MSTSTIIKLVRWRVRDFAACFYACRFPTIGEPDCSTSTGQMLKQEMIFDPIGESRRRDTNRQKLRKKKRDQERASLESSNQTRNSKKSEDETGELSELSSFAEEEYIVFCFKDDGEIQMVKEKRSSEASQHQIIDHAKKSSRTLNHLNCNESAEETSNHTHVDVVTSANVGDTTRSNEHAEGEGSNDVEIECPPDNIKDRSLASMLSAGDSSDSNQSDASTGSFAFPVLGREWMGSPVHMPKPDDIHLRKQKARVVCLQCCRF